MGSGNTQEVVLNQQYYEIKRGKINGIDIYFEKFGEIEFILSGDDDASLDSKERTRRAGVKDKKFRLVFTEKDIKIRNILDDGKIDFGRSPILESKDILGDKSWKKLTISENDGSRISEIKPFIGSPGLPTFLEIKDQSFNDRIQRSLINKISIELFQNAEQAEQEGGDGGLGVGGDVPMEIGFDLSRTLAARHFQEISIFFNELPEKEEDANTYMVTLLDGTETKPEPIKISNQGLLLNLDSFDDTMVKISQIDLNGNIDMSTIKNISGWRNIKIKNAENKNPVEKIMGRFSDKNDGHSPAKDTSETSISGIFETGVMNGDTENSNMMILNRVEKLDQYPPFIKPPGSKPGSVGITVDALGVQKICKEKPNGIQWLFTKENPEWLKFIGDNYRETRDNGIIAIRKEKDLKDMEVKLMVCADGNTGDNVKDCEFKKRREKEFTVSDKDWRNVELTAYIQYVSGGSTGKGIKGGEYLSLIFRTCQNKNKICGASYRVNLDLLSAGIWGEKEFYRDEKKNGVKTEKATNLLIDRGWKDLANSEKNNYLGIKVIIYNYPDNKNVDNVELAVYVDKSNENNRWDKVKVWHDRKLEGSDFPMYDKNDLEDENVKEDEIEKLITFGAPQVILEMNSTEFNVKKLSVREINVPLMLYK